MDPEPVGEQARASTASALPEALVGRWDGANGDRLLELEDDGSFRLVVAGTLAKQGAAKVDGATLVLDSDQGISSFQWLVDDIELVLIGRNGTVERHARHG